MKDKDLQRLQRAVERTIKVLAAERSAVYDDPAVCSVLYSNSSRLASEIVADLRLDYQIVIRERRRKVVNQ